MKPVAASAGHGLVRRFISLALAVGLAIATASTMAPAVSAASTFYVGPDGGSGGCAAPAYNAIQDAVDAAVTGDTIHICAGTYSLAATITVSKDLTFVGDGAGSTIVDGTNAVQIVNVIGSITVSGLTFQNGVDYYLNGGAIAATGDVTVTNSTFSGNESSSWGGGSSSRGGGAIYANGTVSVTNSTFSNNACGGLGGGAINANGAGSTGSIVSVTNSTFSGNQASGVGGLGGAIYAQGDGTVSVTNSTFSSNSALIGGGAIYANVGGAVTVTNSTFSNQTSSYGGAIYANGTLSVTNSTFSNQTSSYGGAIYANVDVAVTVTNSTFSSNSALIGGGAIYANVGGAVTVTNSTFSNQTSSYGGAIYANGTLSVTNSTFSNQTSSYAGAIYASGTVTVTNSTFSGNSAGDHGTIYTDASGTVTNSVLAQGATGSNCSSGITSGGGNVSTDSSCGTSTVVSALDLHLGALANNGGPTQTIALGAGSVAIDAGVDGLCPATDQRGVSRPQGAHCDAGAYEAPGVPVTSASISTVVASPSSVTADGSATSTITVTLLDASSNPVSGKTVTLAKSSGPGSPTISAASGPSNGSGVVTFTVKSTTAGADAFQATDTTDTVVITQTASVTFISAGVLDHITLSPSSATITAGGSQAYTATGFAADSNSWDATSSITFTIDGGGSCDGALCTATVAGDHIVTGTDTVGGTIHATATLHVDAAGATPTPTPMATPTPTPSRAATPTPSRAATPPPTSTGVGPASDEPAGTILFLPVALVAFFGSLLLLVIRQRRRVF
jgi:predicted outer membrane repeat protein